jgi:hypothetical protein
MSVNVFEFLLVIVSIVLGLGITELLAGLVRILRGDLVAGKLHGLWMFVIFQLQVQLAWGLWGLRSKAEWQYPEFLLLLLAPVLLYLAAAVIFPSIGSDESRDFQVARTYGTGEPSRLPAQSSSKLSSNGGRRSWVCRLEPRLCAF